MPATDCCWCTQALWLRAVAAALAESMLEGKSMLLGPAFEDSSHVSIGLKLLGNDTLMGDSRSDCCCLLAEMLTSVEGPENASCGLWVSGLGLEIALTCGYIELVSKCKNIYGNKHTIIFVESSTFRVVDVSVRSAGPGNDLPVKA